MPLPPADNGTITVSGNDALIPGTTTRFARRQGPGFMTIGVTTIQTYLASVGGVLPGVSPSRIRVIQAVAPNEGRLEAINSYDNSFLSFGILQWTAGPAGEGGELPGFIQRLKQEQPAAYQNLLGTHGVDMVPIKPLHTGHISIGGQVLKTAAEKTPLREALWAYRFWRAGHDDTVRACELKHALSRIDDFMGLQLAGGRPVSAFLTSEIGVALLFDEHVNRPGHVPGTLRDGLNASGLSQDPTGWTDADEATLLQNYIDKRNLTNMTSSAQRAAAIFAIPAAQLSRGRGSFQA
jgi:hypothetical protein